MRIRKREEASDLGKDKRKDEGVRGERTREIDHKKRVLILWNKHMPETR